MGIDAFESDGRTSAVQHELTAPYLLYCGRREPLKGTPLLIDYFAAFRARTGTDIRLLLTGAGPVQLASAIAPYVTDLGFVDEQTKHDVMAGALAFCHPSVNESFGIVILEAWQAGTPVLVHAGSAVLQQHCRDSNGGLWFRTYPEFEESLLLLLQHSTLAETMGANGRRYVRERYSWPAIERKLVSALDTVCPPGGRT
jgi:glycosyltransferase involved in cell wall biosynthesis